MRRIDPPNRPIRSRGSTPYCATLSPAQYPIGFNYTHLLHFSSGSLHQHRHFELALVAAGTLYHYVNGCWTLLEAGDMVLLRPGDIHVQDAGSEQTVCGESPTELLNIAFSTEHFHALQRLWEDLDVPLTQLLEAPEPPVVTVDPNLFRAMYEQFNASRLTARNHTTQRLALRQLLVSLLVPFLTPTQSVQADCPEWLSRLCRDMQRYENFTAPMDTMVQRSGYTREHLSRCMKRYLGITPSSFIYGLRIQYAADLLRCTELPVLEVCMRSGFENTAYFHKKFREQFDMSPLQYRESMQKKSQ